MKIYGYEGLVQRLDRLITNTKVIKEIKLRPVKEIPLFFLLMFSFVHV